MMSGMDTEPEADVGDAEDGLDGRTVFDGAGAWLEYSLGAGSYSDVEEGWRADEGCVVGVGSWYADTVVTGTAYESSLLGAPRLMLASMLTLSSCLRACPVGRTRGI